MTILDCNKILFRRYITIVHLTGDTPSGDLKLVLNLARTAINEELLEDKSSRWLGFIQGILYSNNLIDIEEERNLSRILFHQAYKDTNISIPKSIEV